MKTDPDARNRPVTSLIAFHMGQMGPLGVHI